MTATKGCSLLLVDDSEDDVYLFKRALARHPYFRIVGWAEDGVHAISYLSGSGQYADRTRYPWPHVIILDLKMPRRDGYDVLQWLQGKSPRPKVAVFTTSDLREDKTRTAELGADMFQHKTFQLEALDAFITRLESLCQSAGC